MQISRRGFMAALGAVGAALGLGKVPGVSAAPVAEPYWAVGTPGEMDWMAVRAPTMKEAVRTFNIERHGLDCDVPEEAEQLLDFVGTDAMRVPLWDGIPGEIQPADWVRAGMGTECDRCGSESYVGDEAGLYVFRDLPVCGECLEPEELKVVDFEAWELRYGDEEECGQQGGSVHCGDA